MSNLFDIVNFLNTTLMIDQVGGDPSNNGLQIEGKFDVNKIICSVDVSKDLIYKAIDRNADMIFVHHGLSWGSSLKYITNYNAALVKPILKNDISVFAAHLPLDAHPEFGHNSLLADILRLQDKIPFANFGGIDIGVMGKLTKSIKAKKLGITLHSELKSVINAYAACTEKTELKDECIILGEDRLINSVGIVSGSGGINALMAAIDCGLDCLITGEMSHIMYHVAKENNVSVIAAGHYNTEVPGVVAIMDLLKENFTVDAEFIDIPTGI